MSSFANRQILEPMVKDIIIDYFKDKYDVAAVYLFGSFLKGYKRIANDLDIGILLKNNYYNRPNDR